MPPQSLIDYIVAARKKGHSDNQIKTNLLAAGWDRGMVASGLKAQADLPVPSPPTPDHHIIDDQPRPVVQNFSTRGLEYIIMFIALGVAATSLGSILNAAVNALFNTNTSFWDVDGTARLAFSALIVSFPILAYLFMRLKQAEHTDHTLRLDPSRKRAIQLTLIITFLIGLSNVVFFLTNLMSSGGSDATYNVVGSQASSNILGNFVNLVITLAIAGSIFGYYWRDIHQGE